MVKNRTIAKQRLDKYYNLAKEKGYRARSAFKLVQLNKKYGFLKDANILIDLCAAPGGWLQVAAQEMPRPRKIIGIDLDPIKYIADAETFVCDITSDECRKRLYGMLEDRLADVILHDGAPNVGTSWENDAFVQNELVVHSLNLLSLFLREGGTFVTKIFRSKDYDSLISVCSKMFRKVEATKPLSSRSQSAEIFVVCLDYVGINNFDASILNNENIFFDNKETEDDFIDCKYRKISFTDFLKANDDVLETFTEIVIDISEESRKKILEDEFTYLFKDLKCIGSNEKKKIQKKKKHIIKNIKNGKLFIEELSFLKDQAEVMEVSNDEESFEMITLTDDQKLDKIVEEIKENTFKSRIHENIKNVEKIDRFYEDDLFKNLEMFEEEDESYSIPKKAQQDEKKIEIDSCSDSMDLNEEELLCIAKYKENPEQFVEDTIDRYWVDPEEKLPNYLREDQYENGRPHKYDEHKLTKKEKEALIRRKSRAERRAEKFMKELVVEESDEERLLAKEVYRKEFKKTKKKSRIIFPKKGKFGVPKGKGKMVFFDRRLKADKKTSKTKK